MARFVGVGVLVIVVLAGLSVFGDGGGEFDRGVDVDVAVDDFDGSDVEFDEDRDAFDVWGDDAELFDDEAMTPDQLREHGRTLRLGGSAAGEVDVDEGWVAQVELTQDVSVRIDVRGAGGFDAVATLRDANGVVVARNDDRGDAGVDRAGGDQLDPLLEAELAAGVYELEVVGFATMPGEFTVRLDPSGA